MYSSELLEESMEDYTEASTTHQQSVPKNMKIEEYNYNLADYEGSKREYGNFTPTINRPMHSIEGELKPEDRLILAGERYKERQKQMRQEELDRRKAEEDKVLTIQRSAHKQRADLPVEQRLQHYLEKCKYKQQERINKNIADELMLMKDPSINQRSQQIISRKPVLHQ
jgi:hypothetical protein